MSLSNAKSIRLWNAIDHRRVTERFPAFDEPAFVPPILALAISAGDRLLVGRGDGRISIVSLTRTQEDVVVPSATPFPGAASLAWSPEGRVFASVGVSDLNLRLWEAVSGRERMSPSGLASRGLSVAISDDARLIATGEQNGVVRVWDARSGKQLAASNAHPWAVGFVAFTRDNRFLISAGADVRYTFTAQTETTPLGDGTALIWDVAKLINAAPTIGKSPHDFEALWTALEGTDPLKAHEAIWQLATNPEIAVPLLKERLPKIVKPDVADRAAKLLADLDHDDFDVRERASQQLIGIGAGVVPAVRQTFATTKSREVRRRAEEIIAALTRQSASSPDVVLRARGIEVLQRCGTNASRDLLQEWATGPTSSPLAEEARFALQHVKKTR
jgi:WD40 repeat protein